MATSVRRNEVAGEFLAHPASIEGRSGQYALTRIVGLWALATLPMGILGWVVFPRLAPDAASDPLGAGVTRLALLTLGMIWSFILSMLIVRQEEGDLRWSTVKRRLRLTVPRALATSEHHPGRQRWMGPFPVMIALMMAVALVEMVLAPRITAAWVSVFPFLAEPAGYSFGALFKSPTLLARLNGAWWFLALFVIHAAFNAMLGEEFLFRGVLLPRMAGRFGRWSWVANGVLFGLYHVHQPWVIPKSILTGLVYAFPAHRFRSTWLAIILHSAQSVYLALLILGVVLGQA